MNELLLLCCRREHDASGRARLRDLARGPLDWPALVERAVWHRVVPLVAATLARHAADPMRAPAAREAMYALERQQSAIARRNLQLLAELLRVAALLERHRVATIAFKGPVLALTCYGDLARRQFADVDILVDAPDFDRARCILIEAGLRPGQDWQWECSLVDERTGVSVDLHRGVAQRTFPVRLDFPRLYARRVGVPCGGATIATFGASDTLVLLCVQLAKDAAGENALRLSKLCDIAAVVHAHPALDWADVFEQARALGCVRIVALGLSAARELLDVRVPDRWVDANAATANRALLDHVVGRLFGDGERRLSPTRFHLAVRERWRDKLYPHAFGIAQRLVPNERDRAAVALPRGLEGLYYVVRPWRVARDAALRRRSRGPG